MLEAVGSVAAILACALLVGNIVLLGFSAIAEFVPQSHVTKPLSASSRQGIRRFVRGQGHWSK